MTDILRRMDAIESTTINDWKVKLDHTGPLMVPVPRRSPGLKLQPLMV